MLQEIILGVTLARREKPSLYSTRLESLKLMQKEAKEQFIRRYETSKLSYGEFVKDIKRSKNVFYRVVGL